MVVGSAIGTGLFLGLWYFLIHLLGFHYETGAVLPLYAYLGAVLGASTALGLGLSEPVLLEDGRDPDLDPPRWLKPFKVPWLPDLLAVVLSTLALGLVHAILSAVIGFPWRTTLNPAVAWGFAASLGISPGLFGQPRAGRKLGRWGWLWRLSAAAALVASTQVAASQVDPDAAWTIFTYSGGKLFSILRNLPLGQFFSELPYPPLSSLQDQLAVLNAAMLGILISLSSALGMHAALHTLVSWRKRGKEESEK
jgi:hypothetical protein